jgi:hypothetical protein
LWLLQWLKRRQKANKIQIQPKNGADGGKENHRRQHADFNIIYSVTADEFFYPFWKIPFDDQRDDEQA